MEETEIIEKLRAFICQEILHRPDYPLEDDQPMITGGLIDSYALVHIAVFVEDTFSVYIPDTEFTVENMNTLSNIAARVLAAA